MKCICQSFLKMSQKRLTYRDENSIWFYSIYNDNVLTKDEFGVYYT